MNLLKISDKILFKFKNLSIRRVFLLLTSIIFLFLILKLLLSLEIKDKEIVDLRDKLGFSEYKIKRLNDELTLLKEDEYKWRNNVYEDSNLIKAAFKDQIICDPPSEHAIYTNNKEYYTEINRRTEYYEICKTDNLEATYSNWSSWVVEAKMQSGHLLFTTMYGDKMFITNFEKNTLNFIDIRDFPDSSRVYNADGSPDLWLFGPREDDYKKLSPKKDKLIFGASGCHDCDGLIQEYVLNLDNLSVTYIGGSNGSAKWIDNDTVTWTEVYWRDNKIENGETKTKKL